MKKIIIYHKGVRTENLYYEIDELGNVYSLTITGKGQRRLRKTPYLLNPQKLGGGIEKKYRAVNIGRKMFYIHHLMIWSFYDRDYRKEGLEINHKDGDKRNNCLSNLEVVTRKQNMDHAISTGLLKLRRDYKHTPIYTRLKWMVCEKDYTGDILNIYKDINEAVEKTGISKGILGTKRCHIKWDDVAIVLYEEGEYRLYDGWYKMLFACQKKRIMLKLLKKYDIKLKWNKILKKDFDAKLYFQNRYNYIVVKK